MIVFIIYLRYGNGKVVRFTYFEYVFTSFTKDIDRRVFGKYFEEKPSVEKVDQCKTVYYEDVERVLFRNTNCIF